MSLNQQTRPFVTQKQQVEALIAQYDSRHGKGSAQRYCQLSGHSTFKDKIRILTIQLNPPASIAPKVTLPAAPQPKAQMFADLKALPKAVRPAKAIAAAAPREVLTARRERENNLALSPGSRRAARGAAGRIAANRQKPPSNRARLAQIFAAQIAKNSTHIKK